jgi:hypothetical protein
VSQMGPRYFAVSKSGGVVCVGEQSIKDQMHTPIASMVLVRTTQYPLVNKQFGHRNSGFIHKKL